MTSSGGMGEAEVGGPSFSIVPKTGGNTVKGSLYASNVTKGMVGDNYTDDLKARGLTTPGALTKLWDYNIGVGGPIRKDSIWFFAQFRDESSYRTVPGMFANANANAGDPAKWTYQADTTRPAVQAGSWRNGALRLTLQPSSRNKVNLFWDEQHPCQGGATLGFDGGCRQSGDHEVICGAPGSSNQDPEVRANADQRRLRHLQRAQLRRGVELQPGLQPDRQLARADRGAAAALPEVQRPIRFLIARGQEASKSESTRRLFRSLIDGWTSAETRNTNCSATAGASMCGFTYCGS